MKRLRWLQRGLAAALLGATVASTLPTAEAAPWSNRLAFASPRFEEVWRQTDANPGSRSLTWGPRPWFDYKESYKQAPNGLRQVQYFDKARMEINNPSDTSGPLKGVTNGLLPVEMVSGRAKVGDAASAAENDQRTPAAIPVAGDLARVNPDAPTYASFARVATTDNSYTDRNRVGEKVGATFDKNGNIGFNQTLADLPGTNIVQYTTNTGHNIPKVFFDYQNGLPVPAIAAFGYPITDPYWIRAKVGGVDKDIMVQLYERRVLTYTPSNNDPFKVEMGNVGQHYFQWRYAEMGTPWDAQDPSLAISFASNSATPGHEEVFTIGADGANVRQLTLGGNATTPYSVRRSWLPEQQYVAGSSTRDAGRQQLYRISFDGVTQRRLHESVSNDLKPAVSPDGTKIVFTTDRTGRFELYMLAVGGLGLTQLTRSSGTCVNDNPAWLPDGSGIVYESNCQGNNLEIYRADLKVNLDKLNDLQVDLVNVRRLTSNTTADRAARVAPDGTRIAFVAERDGNAEVYVMNADGGQQRRLSNSNAADNAPSWSPNGTQLVFQSNRDGDDELYLMNANDGSGQVQITNNAANDRTPIWAQ